MNKALAIIVLVVGLSACHAGFGIGDNGPGPTYVATDSWDSAVAQASIAQASIGGVVPTAY